MNTDHRCVVREMVLDKIRLTASRIVDKDLLSLRVYEEPAEVISDELLFELEAAMYGRSAQHTLTLSMPANWLEHLKERFAPNWMRKRYPVRRKTLSQTIHAAALFPNFVPPQNMGRERVIVRSISAESWNIS